MSEMIERVARILEPQAWAALGTGDTLAYQNRRTSSLRKARRALEAMRDPTKAMLKAPGELLSSDEYVSVGLSALAWPAMIDEALK